MTRSEHPDLHGLLIVDKPIGLTSHDVVSRVRRLAGMKRVGHGGTLDPFATGVLVVAVGRATKLLQYVQSSDKRYVTQIVLGATTDTLDVDGVVTQRRDIQDWPTRDDVERALQQFVGTIQQVPPAYSAIKIDGRKMYELARAGQSVEIPVRTVTIHSIAIVSYEPPDLVIDVACGKGTYIRSLARDIGDELGTFAYCHTLRRTLNGPFADCEAWTLDALSERDLRAEWPEIGLHPDAILEGFATVIVDGAGAEAWYHGRPVHVSTEGDWTPAELVRAYDSRGRFLGVGTLTSDRTIQPSLVFPQFSDDDGGWPER